MIIPGLTLEQMAEALKGQGKSSLVCLYLESNYFEEAFIQECLAEIHNLLVKKQALGKEPNALEKLAIILLTDSAIRS